MIYKALLFGTCLIALLSLATLRWEVLGRYCRSAQARPLVIFSLRLSACHMTVSRSEWPPTSLLQRGPFYFKVGRMTPRSSIVPRYRIAGGDHSFLGFSWRYKSPKDSRDWSEAQIQVPITACLTFQLLILCFLRARLRLKPDARFPVMHGTGVEERTENRTRTHKVLEIVLSQPSDKS